ncbi:MAG: N-acetylmuramic acid 6-phosphate etherase [Gammaproteobacteria bacterium]|nr:N-acetylmuramic acid 6-phosphate etherase [Gammaproteobacteria bacterium]
MMSKDRIDLDGLTTEGRNPRSGGLDRLDSLELVRLINAEDDGVAAAVGLEATAIADAIDVIAERLARGGRLVYLGAGTSGRLGVLDAVECPPTFNTDAGQVIGLIAGGPDALLGAVEGAEDSREQGRTDLENVHLISDDVVVGIAASGRTPYVLGALDYARSVGAATIGFSCNAAAPIHDHADLVIAPVVGPEVLSGSTRMRAGTATKMVLNMLSTGAMVRLGKVYDNLMVDVRASNEKLVERSVRILEAITGCARAEAEKALESCDGDLKTAVVSQQKNLSPADAGRLLATAGGNLRRALEQESEP